MTLFIFMRVALAVLVDPEDGLPHLVLGITASSHYARAFTIAILTTVLVFALWIALSCLTLANHPRATGACRSDRACPEDRGG